MNYGFVKTAAVIPQVLPADIEFNRGAIVRAAETASQKGAEIILFPELCLTGYTCGDMFLNELLLKKSEEELLKTAELTKELDSVIIIGLPLACANALINAAAVIFKGEILGVIPKNYLPNYKEFYEKRYFASAAELKTKTIELAGKQIPLGSDLLFKTHGAAFAGRILGKDRFFSLQKLREIVNGADLQVDEITLEVVAEQLVEYQLVVENHVVFFVVEIRHQLVELSRGGKGVLLLRGQMD